MLNAPAYFVAINDNAQPSAAERFALDMESLRHRAAARSGSIAIFDKRYAYELQLDGTYAIKGNGTTAVAEPLPGGAGFRVRVTGGRGIPNVGFLTLVASAEGLRVKK